MRAEWVDCPSPSDFEVWTKTYDQFGDEIPRFFPWEGLTGPQRGILAEVYHVHEKEEWYDREECGINACAVYLLTRSAKEALISRHLTGRADPDYTKYLTPPELWLIMTVFRDDHQKLVLALNIWIKYLRMDVRRDQVRALLDNN